MWVRNYCRFKKKNSFLLNASTLILVTRERALERLRFIKREKHPSRLVAHDWTETPRPPLDPSARPAEFIFAAGQYVSGNFKRSQDTRTVYFTFGEKRKEKTS